MSGISDKAIKSNYAENKYRFQKQELQNQEFSDGSGLEMYEFKYRMDDPQIGRFWSVDPLANKYVYNSPYAFSEDKVINSVEQEGLEATLAISWEYNQSRERAKTEGGEQGAKEFDRGSATAGKAAAIGVVSFSEPLVGVPLILSQTTGVPVTPSPQAMAGSAGTVLTDEAAANLQQRADDIHATLSPITQTKTTTAVGLATTADGANVTLVASSEKVLRPAQIAALQPGEVAVSGVGHAEATIMNYADKTGMSVQAVAANRPICTSCAVSIASGGAQAVTPYKNPAQAITAINAFNASLPIPLTSK